MTPGLARAVVGSCATLILGAGAGAERRLDAGRAYLTDTFHLTQDELKRIDRGSVVARTMRAGDRREIATLGVVRMRITAEYYTQGFDDISSFKRDAAILQIGTFGRPPTVEDVAGLTLDEADIRALRECRVGSCDLQLSADAIRRFGQLDWLRADARDRADALMRQILVEYVAEYFRAGATAAMEYADQPEPLNLQREFLALADSTLAGWPVFPALRRHLAGFPSTAEPGVNDLLYWSKEKIGRKGVASVTHVAISRPEDDSPVEYAIASKHLYGTHYYDASLGMTVLVRDPASPTAATFVVYVNRSRIDVFDGLFGGLTRKIVSGRARTTVSSQLARMQGTLEREFAAARGSEARHERPSGQP